jgi:hypothetical protein
MPRVFPLAEAWASAGANPARSIDTSPLCEYVEVLTNMCRNIKTLANFEPPATDDEIRASALQFVRKLSGTTRPSRVNEAAFNRAVDEVTATAHRLIHSLQINAAPRNREDEAHKARERSLKRFAGAATSRRPDGAG